MEAMELTITKQQATTIEMLGNKFTKTITVYDGTHGIHGEASAIAMNQTIYKLHRICKQSHVCLCACQLLADVVHAQQILRNALAKHDEYFSMEYAEVEHTAFSIQNYHKIY